jgi:hypothetical protein
VGELVGEGGHPGDVGLSGAERLHHRGVAGRDLRAQDEAAVFADEAGELVAALHQGPLLDRGDEEHPDHALAARLERGATVQTPEKADEQEDDEAPPESERPEGAGEAAGHARVPEAKADGRGEL